LGSLPPTEGDVTGDHLNFVSYDGKKAHFTPLGKFDASRGIFGFGRRPQQESIYGTGQFPWCAVKNQFFAAILTPQRPATAFLTAPLSLKNFQKDSYETGISGIVTLPLGKILPQTTATIIMDYYVGPKEYTRLDRLGQRQDLVMQFGWFGFVSKLLLLTMKGIHYLIPNWGFTIILLTVLVKLILWPLTTAQMRSTRGMAKIQPQLEAIRAKYKNNTQKTQQETLRLFRENHINPAAGCLPIFFQIPIIIGLYFMLRTASELRFAHFLWIRDLSVMDTVAHIHGFPLNPLPFVMALAAFWQMRTTPMTAQNALQKRLFQTMPFIFLFFCYRFPSGLVLYWTVQNLLSITQQYITNRRLRLDEHKESIKRPREKRINSK
jgi:YidC/Oxa1 family membrane protein insertase